MSGQVPFKTLTPRYEGIYRGEVMDNNDPLKRGRCKIAIRPMFSDGTAIATADLPWAIPAYPIFEGANVGVGYFAVPKVGSKVFCFFEEGDPYSPVYAWEVPDKVNGIPSSATTNYPNRKVVKTTSGIEIILDDTSKEIIIQNEAGGVVRITGSGSIIINSPSDITISGSSVSINP